MIHFTPDSFPLNGADGRSYYVGCRFAHSAEILSRLAATRHSQEGEIVPQAMRWDWFGNPANSVRLLASVLHRVPCGMTAGYLTREQPLPRLCFSAPLTQR